MKKETHIGQNLFTKQRKDDCIYQEEENKIIKQKKTSQFDLTAISGRFLFIWDGKIYLLKTSCWLIFFSLWDNLKNDEHEKILLFIDFRLIANKTYGLSKHQVIYRCCCFCCCSCVTISQKRFTIQFCYLILMPFLHRYDSNRWRMHCMNTWLQLNNFWVIKLS